MKALIAWQGDAFCILKWHGWSRIHAWVTDQSAYKHDPTQRDSIYTIEITLVKYRTCRSNFELSRNSNFAFCWRHIVLFEKIEMTNCQIQYVSRNKRPVGLSSFVNCPSVVASFLTQRQLSINAGWQHMGRVPHPNYVDPECCVATVCHQVRFMYWEHLGHFQRAISHLKWHKIVRMRYLACTFSQMKSTDMFSIYLQSGVPRHFIWWFIAGWT